MATIIGRHKEIAELNELYKSDKAELVAVYGRRRVGNGSSDTKVRFNKLFNQWWEETCVFSGRNFYIANPNFKEMLNMGSSILPYIKDIMQSEPQYKQRALKWLFDAVVAL